MTEYGKTTRERVFEALGRHEGIAEVSAAMRRRDRDFAIQLLRGGALIFGKPLAPVQFTDGQPMGLSNEDLAGFIERSDFRQPDH